MRGLLRDESAVAGHAPVKAACMSITHDVEEIRAQKRLPARDAQLDLPDVEIRLHLVEDVPVLLCCKVALLPRGTAAAAVKAVLVAAQGKLQEKLSDTNP